MSKKIFSARLTSQNLAPYVKGSLRRLQILRDLLFPYWRIERRLAALEAFSHGGRTTYMGDGLVLVKADVNGVQIIYLVEASDRLLAPWFIASGRYETELTEHFGRILRKDDHCLDIGANFGYFTLLFGRFCPQGKSIG
jgi:hypothetical protein